MLLIELPNLGAHSAKMLAAAGIFTRSQLEALGPVKAFLAAKQAGGKPTMNLLWAIAGAITDQKWDALSHKYKEQLRAELEQLLANGKP